MAVDLFPLGRTIWFTKCIQFIAFYGNLKWALSAEQWAADSCMSCIIRIVWALHMICCLELFRWNNIKISHTLPFFILSLDHHLRAHSKFYCALHSIIHLCSSIELNEWEGYIALTRLANRHFFVATSAHRKYQYAVQCTQRRTYSGCAMYHNCMLLGTCSSTLFYQHFAW